jgi:glutathione S-transferase
MTSKPYQLFYWPIPGRAEAARVALSLANLDWEDVSLDRELFATMKNNGDLPWGMVPLLKTPDGGLAESVAILRYLGHKCGLVPESSYLAAKVDEFIDGINPHFSMLEGTFSIDDLAERIKAREALFLPGAKGTRGLKLLEKKIQESSTPWIAGTKEMSIADLMVFTYAFGLFSGNFDGIYASVLEEYPVLLAYHDVMANEPRIQAHYAELPEGSLRWTYQPNAFAQ